MGLGTCREAPALASGISPVQKRRATHSPGDILKKTIGKRGKECRWLPMWMILAYDHCQGKYISICGK